MSLSQEKNILRKIIASRIKNYTAEELSMYSLFALNKLEKDSFFITSETIMLYWSKPDEVQTRDFIEKWKDKKNILLPVIVNNQLEAHIYKGSDSMELGPYAIYQPLSNPFTGNIDLIIVPGRAFDLKGNRIGRGKGYYDSFLKTFKGKKYGLCFDFQIQENIPVEPRDIKVDAVICN